MGLGPRGLDDVLGDFGRRLEEAMMSRAEEIFFEVFEPLPGKDGGSLSGRTGYRSCFSRFESYFRSDFLAASSAATQE